MAGHRSTFLEALFAPKVVKIGALAWLLFAGYDTLCSQFGLPTIGTLVGKVNGSLLPWWGWLLILQAILVYALFEYVRRNVGAPQSPTFEYDDSDLRNKAIEADTRSRAAEEAVTALRETVTVNDDKARKRLEALETSHRAITDDYQRMLGLEARFEGELDGLKEALQKDFRKANDRFEILERRQREGQEADAATFDEISLAFLALRSREKLKFYADIIREEARFLIGRYEKREPIKGDDWAEWEMHHQAFEGALSHWFEVGKGWQPKIEEWVENIDRNDLTGERWQGIDDLFKDSNHSTIFKTFYLRLANWGGLMGRVGGAVEAAAFGGHDAMEMLAEISGGPPTADRVRRALSD